MKNDLALKILKESRIIAVAGLSAKPERTSHQVTAYLQKQGYHIIPVNPSYGKVLGEHCYPDLKSIPKDIMIDLLLIFRNPAHVLPLVEAALNLDSNPRYIWMQDGIICDRSAELCREKGIPLVMDDCTFRRHRQFSSQGLL